MSSGSQDGARIYPSSEVVIAEDDKEIRSPIEAKRTLVGPTAKRGYAANRQPEGPFWITFPVEGWGTQEQPKVIELRMLRSASIQFWAAYADDKSDPVPLIAQNEKGGTAIRLRLGDGSKADIIGRVEPIGVVRPKIFLWDEGDFTRSEMHFERWGGALVGSLVVLAIFSALVAAINRDWSFFLFAGWLITSLRVASINEGWDLIWLGVSIESEKLLILLRVTLAAHALLTISLFRSLLESSLKETKFAVWLQYSTFGFLILVLTAAWIPHRTFLPVLWSSAAVGMLLILTSLARIVIKQRSSVSIWYACSWGFTFAGIFTEVAYAAGLTSLTLPGLNSQSASIASALVTAISLAEKLRIERLARLTAQREKFDALAKFKENYNSMPIGLFSMDRSGEISLYNPAFATIFGIDTPKGVISMRDLIGPVAFSLLRNDSAHSLKTDIELEVEADGSPDSPSRWFLARVTARDGFIEGSIQDITTRKEAETKLKHLVDHDPLSGLLNRRGLEQVLKTATSVSQDGTPCAIAHVDMDRFKLVNDLYGHAVGDGMIQAAAGRLSKAIRATDRIARIADSFIIVLMDCPDHAVTRLTERLREMISERPFEIEGMVLSMTVSIGVVPLEPTMTTVAAMAAADRACGEAKAKGRNCVVRLNESDAALRSHLDELRVVAGLRQRVPTERYFLEFQPIVSLRAANQSLNYEVLLRMRSDDGGIIPPGRFIGAAERNGLMSQIDRWVLQSTLEWLDQHPAHRDRLTFATLNLSGASLNDARFVEDAFAMIAEHPIASTKLCFEITESIALHDVGSTRKFVDRVRAFGSKLALDDFGAGYTSFNYLKEIPADFIKIDGSFIKDINKNPGNYAITRTIVDLAHELGMSSIAEWAETQDTIASLIHLQVDYAQGFGLARPMQKELVTNAISSASLIRDPAVVTMLIESNLQVIAMHPAKPRRS